MLSNFAGPLPHSNCLRSAQSLFFYPDFQPPKQGRGYVGPVGAPWVGGGMGGGALIFVPYAANGGSLSLV